MMSTDRQAQLISDGGIGGGIAKLFGIYCYINQWIAAQIWWLHGPPFHPFQAFPATSNTAHKFA
jgi:hypothetical protein